MINGEGILSLGRMSLRSGCRKGVGLHLYSERMRRKMNKGVKVLIDVKDSQFARKFA
jgi:hypothetical protein